MATFCAVYHFFFNKAPNLLGESYLKRLMKPQNLINQRRSTVSTATSVFDNLDFVSLDFALGQWKGFEIITGHPMEGPLEP